jgi:hypothetical protein
VTLTLTGALHVRLLSHTLRGECAPAPLHRQPLLLSEAHQIDARTPGAVAKSTMVCSARCRLLNRQPYFFATRFKVLVALVKTSDHDATGGQSHDDLSYFFHSTTSAKRRCKSCSARFSPSGRVLTATGRAASKPARAGYGLTCRRTGQRCWTRYAALTGRGCRASRLLRRWVLRLLACWRMRGDGRGIGDACVTPAKAYGCKDHAHAERAQR